MLLCNRDYGTDGKQGKTQFAYKNEMHHICNFVRLCFDENKNTTLKIK